MRPRKNNNGTTSALYVWNGLCAFWGTSFNTAPHHHNTLQLVFDIDKTFYLKDEDQDWVEYSSAIIKSNHVHQFQSNNSIQLFIYLDADSEYGIQLTKRYLSNCNINNLEGSDIGKVSSNFFKKLLILSDCKQLYEGFLTIIRHLINFEKPKLKDERILKAISFISTRTFPYKVKDIAEHVHLSESRLRFLFKKEVGQSIQSFMLWIKVVTSLNLVLKGRAIANTALDVGFWDASHMNKSYKDLLGVAPSALRKYERHLKIIACEESNFYTFRTEILKNWESKSTPNIITI